MSESKLTMLQIDYFLAVAERLSFTEAAIALYTSQPSVSKQIAMLENQVGTELFYRTKRSVRLTAAGEALYEDLRDISDNIEHAIKKATVASTEESNTLNIGIFYGIETGNFLPGFLHKFRSEHGNIILNFERRHMRELREKLINGEFDIIVTLSFDIVDICGIETRLIKRFNSCILVPGNDPLAGRDSLTITDLKDSAFVIISIEESPSGHNSIIKLCENYGFTPNIVEELPNLESLLLAVQTGVGVTIVDNEERHYEQNGIKAFFFEEDFHELVSAWKRGNPKPALGVFIDELAIYMSEHTPGQ